MRLAFVTVLLRAFEMLFACGCDGEGILETFPFSFNEPSLLELFHSRADVSSKTLRELFVKTKLLADAGAVNVFAAETVQSFQDGKLFVTVGFPSGRRLVLNCLRRVSL